MVLSNKKLKKKFRDLLAESLAASDSKTSGTAAREDVDEQMKSIKETLISHKKKPRPSKREKRRRKPQPSSLPSSSNGNKENEVETEESNQEKKTTQEDKKRKREGDRAAQEFAEREQRKKIKQEKREARRKKDQKNDNEDGDKKTETVNAGGNENKITSASNFEQSEQNRKKVYVGGIPYYSTEDDIMSFFQGCGTVTEVDCMRFPESGKFRGIAILTFKTEAAAERALSLDGADMGGFYLKIQPYKPNREQKSDFTPEIVEGYNRIYVGNLAWEISEDDLRKLFSNCKISSIRSGMDKETGDFKGYAHIDFADSASLTTALQLDQTVVCGRPVRIRCAIPKKEAETKLSSKPDVKNAQGGTAARGSKKKRRTCYQCGVPGHLSAACPQKSDSSKVNTG